AESQLRRNDSTRRGRHLEGQRRLQPGYEGGPEVEVHRIRQAQGQLAPGRLHLRGWHQDGAAGVTEAIRPSSLVADVRGSSPSSLASTIRPAVTTRTRCMCA